MLKLKSGKELPADIIVTATGFHLNVLGDIAFEIDGKPLDFSQTVTYRGMMFTGVPNMAWVFGYFRASWTLRADLVADFVCRLLGHMKDKQARRVEVALRPEDKDMPLLPWIDTENFNPGYVTRGMHLLPRRGDKREWQHTQDYWREKNEIPKIDLDDNWTVTPSLMGQRTQADGNFQTDPSLGDYKIARFRLDPRDRRTDADYYELVGDDDGVFGCMSLLACHDVCPKNLPLATQIAFMRRKMVAMALK